MDSISGVSVVVPLYIVEDNVVIVYEELSSVMKSMQCRYELIFVDDGSSDQTLPNLIKAAAGDPFLRIIEFRRNFGQTAAMAAGLEHSRYNVVVTMDGDLQNDPHEIPRMVSKLNEGYDLVAGWRKDRKDAFINRRLPSMIANWTISKSTGVKLHDYGCSLKVMTGELARGLRLYGEMHRFIPALANQIGAKIVEMPVNHRPRIHGKTKYGISRTIRVILDLITVKFLLGYAKRPIHLFGSVGFLSAGLGGLLLVYMMFQKFFLHVPMGNRPLLMLAVMMVIVGMQFIVFGLLAEVLARTYYESQNKRTYVVRRYIENKHDEEERLKAVGGDN
jgi:glycosyltransferase involved in cell wall biosynthesis